MSICPRATDSRTRDFAGTFHPLVVRDVIVVGGMPGGASDIVNDEQPARMEAPPGDVRGFDVRTGKLLWIFHTVPAIGEFGHDTWLKESRVVFRKHRRLGQLERG